MIADAFASLVPVASAVTTTIRNATIENPRFNLNDPGAWETFWGGGASSSGVSVTHQNAPNIASVWQALSLISGDVSKLTLYPYIRGKDDDRDIDDKHAAYQAVSVQANPWKSAWDFWRDFEVHDLLWNNAYAFIAQGRNGIELYNLLPDRTAPEWIELPGGRMELVYVTDVGGKLETLMASQVLHVRGISLDGVQGADLVKHARDTWGLALAAQGFQSKFFKNGARIGGVLELPATMNPKAINTVEEGFRKQYEAGDNPFKTVILRDNAKFHAGQFSPEQSMTTDVTEQGKRDTASYFNLPPSKLGIRDSVSYNSFEQDNLSYLHGCLHHRLASIASQCNLKLLTVKERRDDTHYFEHNVSKFLQADWKTLNEGLEIMRRNEVINADEWRRKINMNKRPDGKGGEYLNPNTKSAAEGAAAKESKPKEKPANLLWLTDTLNRMARRVGADARREAKDGQKFANWLESGYRSHVPVFDEAVSPIAKLQAADFANNVRGQFFSELNSALYKLLEPPYTAGDLAKNVDREMTKFEQSAGERIANYFLEGTENV